MMDAHALEVLEFPKVRRHIARGAVSSLGREAIEGTEPWTDIADIRRELACSDEMAQAVRWDDPVPMRGVMDIRAAVSVARRVGARLDASALLDIAQTAESAARLRKYFEARREKFPRLWDIASALEGCPEVVERINRAIDPSGMVRDSASPKLGRLRRELDQARATLRSNLERLVNRLGADVLSDRLVAMRGGRPVIPVRASHKNAVAGIVHDQSATGQTIFIEPLEAVEDSNRIREIEIAEQHEVDRILAELTDRVRDHLPKFEVNLRALARLDALYAIGTYAGQNDAVAPRLAEDGTFELVEMRHPLLDIRLKSQGSGAVPLTCRIRPDTHLVVISGPNAGGKTVALKTIGLAIAMTQAGFLIPAHHLTALPVFGHLFAEIGDEQSIENDLSTFSSRMSHLAHICEEALEDTLILVDELGSSTDPEQGAALSRAILSHWATRRARVFVTTHLGSLKEFAHEQPWAVNASMEFDQTTLRPTFRLVVGIPGSSYALEISRRVGLSTEIISAAEAELGEGGVKAEKLIAELTRHLEEARAVQEDMERRERELAEREAEYAERFTKVAADRKRMVREAREEAERIVREARSLVERTVADLRRTQGSTEAIKDARRELQDSLEKTRAALRESADRQAERPKDLEVGNWVRLKPLGTTGELVSLGKDRGAVQTDSARLEVPLEQIEKVADAPPERQKSGGVAVTSDASSTFAPEIDVRGMTFEDAWQLLDRYLDDATMARYPRVRIIHGKGTGALRTKINRQLEEDERVASHQMGELHEGGAGVTIVNIHT